MMAGPVRFACVLLAVLALLNAPTYSQADIQARQEYNNRWYGGGQKGYNGNYIPDLPTIQESVFKKSFAGPLIKNYLGRLLVVNAVPADKPADKAAPATGKTNNSGTNATPPPVKKTPVIIFRKK